MADHFDGVIVHLNQRDVTLLCVSRAPLEKLEEYKHRMGWRFPWVSSYESDFKVIRQACLLARSRIRRQIGAGTTSSPQ
jgi:predicted dithiol-disulfide oxidoreductase (DUF899 family)